MQIIIAKDLKVDDALNKLREYLTKECAGYDTVADVACLSINLYSEKKGACDKNTGRVVLQHVDVETMLDKIKPELERDINERMWRNLTKLITQIDGQLLEYTKEKARIEKAMFASDKKSKIDKINDELANLYEQQRICHNVELGLDANDFEVEYRFGGDWDVHIKVIVGRNTPAIKKALYFTKDNLFVECDNDANDSHYKIKALVEALKKKTEAEA